MERALCFVNSGFMSIHNFLCSNSLYYMLCMYFVDDIMCLEVHGYMPIHNTEGSFHKFPCTLSVYNLLWMILIVYVFIHTTEGSFRNVLCKVSVYNILCFENSGCISIHDTKGSCHHVLYKVSARNILCITASSQEVETRNGHRNIKQNPPWSSQVSFHTAHLKRDFNFHHRGFRFVFRWPFQVSSSQERAV